MPIFSRIKTAWNAFVNTESQGFSSDYSSSTPSFTVSSPSRPRRRYSSERTIISSIYNRLANDVASVAYRHIRLDDEGRYLEDIKSRMNDCFTLEANLDQGPRAFRQDVALTLFDKGVSVIVPVDTTVDESGTIIDIFTMRVGEIVAWFPEHVKVSLYNEKLGRRQDVLLPKRSVAIVENPWYAVMNEPNSTLQRLIRKLSLLDIVDEQSSSGKLDIIIQLPYVIKSEARKQQAEQRRSDIEFQLKDSKYGIAYTDGTEKITQLNRPAENNLLKTVEFLKKELYEQLGITDDIMSGTADEKTMNNYYNRTIEPILDAIIEAMQRSFLGLVKTVGNERIQYYDNPFKFVPMEQFADIADKVLRNELFSANELRGFMGVKPSKDPKADKLNNSNMPDATVAAGPPSS